MLASELITQLQSLVDEHGDDVVSVDKDEAEGICTVEAFKAGPWSDHEGFVIYESHSW